MIFGVHPKAVCSTKEAAERYVLEAGLVVGAVMVDVAIDQGDCFETSKIVLSETAQGAALKSHLLTLQGAGRLSAADAANLEFYQ